MSAIVPTTPPALPGLLPDEVQVARDFAAAEKAPSTRRAYRSDARRFAAWCDQRGVPALPASPETVAAFLAAEAAAGIRTSTISRRAAAIRYAHRLAGYEPPTAAETVRAVTRGIRRTKGTAPEQKEAATADRLTVMLAACPDTLRGTRDRAILALGFAGAFRRSELVALDVQDLQDAPGGLRVRIRRSKTDQTGQGQEIAVPDGARIRPVAAVKAWLEASGISEGPIFRRISKADRVLPYRLTAEVVADLVQQYAERAGFDAALFAAHSLRAGFLTSGAEAGASVFKLMEVSRHKSVDTLRGYVRRADLFRDHAGKGFL